MGIKLDMVGIVVNDMKASLDFYRTLGLEIPIEADQEQHVEINQDGVRFAFDTKAITEGVYGQLEDPLGHRVELAFRCDSVESLNELFQLVVERGYNSHKEPWDAFWGQRYAVIVDPDGNLISLFA
ncbi:catechol 2,3-dioxygenase-like lactoylglutathione lyase family enzyme [Bacillus mesophilus]|uniref:Glyoxalase n=1 Tax=Bacillus mesophilus TaxID=1808955 RepID=A0A6M0Q8F1_9BACI|nr:VOC family protein [Bacillus mesophilus]MBM7662030.1 catechol 2,3-dioxygenase-like lactoylglutathione lyase family enzyme [Bacillus mesophilus]NEY72614.1 glyoxalase [Bacillus mesophilus]